MKNLIQDTRFAIRRLARRPGFTITAVLTLALAIGANTAVFTVVDSILLRPLAYPEPQELVRLLVTRPGLESVRDNFSEGEYHELDGRTASLAGLAAYDRGRRVNLAIDQGPLSVLGARATANLFSVLGAKTITGRPFSAREDRPGAPASVVISERLWRRAFASDAALVGEQITVNGTPHTVAGILPAGFRFPDDETELWLPLALDRVQVGYQSGQYLRLIGRRAPGLPMQRLAADLEAVSRHISDEKLTRYPGTRVSARPLREDLTGASRPALLLLLGAVGLVLLAACANLAGLMLGRAAPEARLLALRLALGSSRRRVVRLMLTECALLSIAGGGLGLLLAWAGVPALTAWGGQAIPRSHEISIDFTVLAFTSLVVLLVPPIFGLAPCLRALRIDINQALKQGGRGLSGANRERLPNLLVVAETALCFALLSAAGLLLFSLQNLIRTDPGFETEKVLTLRTSLSSAAHNDPVHRTDFLRRALDAVSTLPSVEQTGATSSLPFSGGDFTAFAWREGVPYSPDILPPDMQARFVTPGYLDALRIPVLQGRRFRWSDDAGQHDLAILSQSLAETLWPGETPMGKRFKMSRQPTAATPWRTVVGVVADIRADRLDQQPGRIVYFPYAQWQTANLSLVVRTAADDPQTLVPQIRSKLHEIDPQQPVFAVSGLKQLVAASLARRQFTAHLLSLFAAAGLLLAVLGLYGVVSYSVTRRRREFGLRMAVGARPASIVTLVLGRGLRLSLAGLLLGAALSVALSNLLSSFLPALARPAPLLFLLLSGLLCSVLLAACLLPARRASRTDPLRVLRSE